MPAASNSSMASARTEAALLRQIAPGANIHCVPWALAAQPRRTAFAKRSGIALIGNFAHSPNVDAAVWFAEAVMPLIRRRQADLVCSIAGRAMPAHLAGLTAPGVTVLGGVPQLRSLYDQVRLTVAPLRSGAGVKSKVLESFAAGLPCVTTGVAAEGIGLSPSLQSLVQDDAEALADCIVHLHQDAAANRAAAREGLALIRRRHTPLVVSDALQAAIARPSVSALRVA
jgi:glycosyltransferase involved in cell wall biosynthesis